MAEIFVPPRTVDQWQTTGYRGLRIPCCPTCRAGTWMTWDELGAKPEEDIVSVAVRIRCVECGQPPAGLGVRAFRSEAEA